MRFFSIRVRDNGSFHWNKVGAREFKEGKKEREGGLTLFHNRNGTTVDGKVPVQNLN